MKYYKHKVTNELFGLSSDSSVPLELIEISKDEVDSINNQSVKAQVVDPITKRIMGYGSLQEQLDMIYHDNINKTSNWVDHITAVKKSIPKIW